MEHVPASTPPTLPDAEPTVAIDASLVVHVPPVTVLVSGVAAPAHTCVVPEMAAGIGLTVTL